ncbi:MCE family protein [Amycolatopsis nigrescens]|uniref:MCE family protein n=1 Tax=Amycolatopsis nigrescens TaxID=381445 RepID=UPI00036C6F77|nr:MCE family protein [Amycolatopsis nigrescens]
MAQTMILEDMGAHHRRRQLLRWTALGVLVALLATAIWVFVTIGSEKKLVAYFSAAVGVYPASDVRVLGVAVGSVEAVEPEGQQVKVTMSIREDVQLPANASAVVVTPSLVADRYIQVAPVFTGGDELGDGAEIPVARTATPVEVDQLFTSLNELTTALGPNGANSDGAVSQLLEQGAKTFDGNGKPLGESLKQLGELARTLSGTKDDVFSTVDNLSKFTGMLAANDDQVNQAGQQLSSITKVLADQRDEFSGALTELTKALGTVQGFIRDNRDKVKSNVDKLAEISKILSNQKASLAEALDTAPNTLTNLLEAYNPQTGTLDGRGNLLEYSAQSKASTAAAGSTCPVPGVGGCAPAARQDGLVAVDAGQNRSDLPVLPLPSAELFASPNPGGAQ